MPSPSDSPSRSPGFDARALLPGLFVALAAGTAGFWALLLRLPHQAEKVEVHVRMLVLWWRQGLLPYPPADGIPVLQNPYGPVYLALTALLPDAGPYLAGRLISVVSVAVCLGVVAWWTRELSPTGRLALGGSALWIALLPLTGKPFLIFAPLFRVDSLALALTVAGFVVAVRREAVLPALALFLAAFATKLTFLAAPGAAALYLFLRGRRRLALWIFLGFGLGSVAWVVGMELATHGRFLASAALGNLPTAPHKSLDMLLRTGLWLFWWIACAVLLGKRDPAGSRLERLRRLGAQSPAACYLATALFTTAFFAANPLSSWNYLMEPCIALALLTAEAWHRADDARRRRAARFLLVHGLVSAILMVSWARDVWQELEEHRLRLANLEPCLLRVLEQQPGGAVVGDLAAQDFLAVSDIPPGLAAPDAVAVLPEIRARLDAGLASGDLPWLFIGPRWLGDEPVGDGERCADGKLVLGASTAQ